MGAGVDPRGSATRDATTQARSSRGKVIPACAQRQESYDTATKRDAKRTHQTIRGGKTSEVLEHVKKQTRLLTRMRWGHSLHKVAADAMNETWRGDSGRRGREIAIRSSAYHPECPTSPADLWSALPAQHQGPKDNTDDDRTNHVLRAEGYEGRHEVLSGQCQTRQQLRSPDQAPQYEAANSGNPSVIAPAHGGVGDATGNVGSSAVPARRMIGPARSRSKGPVGLVKGPEGSNRVARLGAALDDVETRASGPVGTDGKGVSSRSAEKLILPCTKRHIKIIRSMTLEEASAAAIGGSSGAADPNPNAPKPNGGVEKARKTAALRAPPSAEGAVTAAATSEAVEYVTSTATATSASTAAAVPVASAAIEGALPLTTVGKTMAFLATLAASSPGGREGDGGAFGGAGKMTGGGGTGSGYGSRQFWYSAAAARTIAQEANDERGSLEEEGEAGLALERRLHAPPAIRFDSENRRGGFGKGMTITYGSTITLQAFHGGILCFNSKGKAQASALGAQPNALLTVWNLNDLQSKGPVRYGDVLLLQMGRHEVMGSSVIMHSQPKTQGGSRRVEGAARASTGGTKEQQPAQAGRGRTSAGHDAGPSKSSTGSSGGGAGGGASAAVGNPVAVPFRGENMEKAKHTGRWVIVHKDDPEGTQGSEVCHLDRVVLMQTWLSLASDWPDDACLKQYGSVDDYFRRRKRSRPSKSAKEGNGGDCASVGGNEGRGRAGGSEARDEGGWQGRGSRRSKDVVKSTFAVRPECGWIISGVEDSGSRKRAGARRRSSATLLEGAATRQLRRSKNTRLVVATNAIAQMRKNGRSIVLRAQEIFDEGQQQRLDSLRQKFLCAFRRQRSRNWLPNRGGDRQLSIVYGPLSPWGKREALRLELEKNKQLEKFTAKAKIAGDIRNPSAFETARAENGALATEAKVKQEVWDALLKRYGYQEVTDMLALMHSASVIRRAIRAMRQRRWTRKLARIDPEMVEKVERLRKIQEQRKANLRGGVSASSTARATDSATSATKVGESDDEPGDNAFISRAPPGKAATGATGTVATISDPAQRPPRPYEALLAGSLEKFESGHQGRGGGGGGGGGGGRASARRQTFGGSPTDFQRRRPSTSGPGSRPRPLGARFGRNNSKSCAGRDGGDRDERWRQRGLQRRRTARPRTAVAGSGGVQGVLARMGGYEQSVFRQFGGDGIGSVVDHQLSQDLVLLDDLRGTLDHIAAWDHTQGDGGIEPVAARSGSVVSSQGKDANVDSPVTGGSPLSPQHQPTLKTPTLSADEVAENELWQERDSDVWPRGLLSAGDKANSGNSKECVPVDLCQRAGENVVGHRRDSWFEPMKSANPEPGPSQGTRYSTGSRRSRGFGGADADTAVLNDDAGSTMTATTATADRGEKCSEWMSKQKKRTAPTPLTDDEQMSLLQHVRPGVFGEPPTLGQQRCKAAAYARPSSAVATISCGNDRHRGGGRRGYQGAPRASTRRTSREGGLPGGSNAGGRKPRASVCSGTSDGTMKHRGVLVHDDWVAAGEPEGSSCLRPRSAGFGMKTPPSGSHLRSSRIGGTDGAACGQRGGVRPVSLVNSVAFEVNMGVLDALSGTTASDTAASAFASAIAGGGIAASKRQPSATSTMDPAEGRWLSSEGGARKSDSEGTIKRGQSAPQSRRQRRSHLATIARTLENGSKGPGGKI